MTVKTKPQILRPLTPANDAEFQDVSANVRVKYFHQSDVHVDRFQPHPGERREKEEVHQGRDGDAEPLHVKRGDPVVQEEAQIQEQQRCAQVHQDFGGKIPSQFSKQENKKDRSYFVNQPFKHRQCIRILHHGLGSTISVAGFHYREGSWYL